MKKFLFAIVCSLMILTASAQSFLGSVYQPVEVENPYGNPILREMERAVGASQGTPCYESPHRQQAPQYQQIRAYRYANGNWYKITLKVFVKHDRVYVHSYQDRSSKMWIDAFNASAQETTRYDGATIYENFDFKARISGFMVYF